MLPPLGAKNSPTSRANSVSGNGRVPLGALPSPRSRGGARGLRLRGLARRGGLPQVCRSLRFLAAAGATVAGNASGVSGQGLAARENAGAVRLARNSPCYRLGPGRPRPALLAFAPVLPLRQTVEALMLLAIHRELRRGRPRVGAPGWAATASADLDYRRRKAA
jgi:hypothetical protein